MRINICDLHLRIHLQGIEILRTPMQCSSVMYTVLGLLPELKTQRCKQTEDASHFNNHPSDILYFSFDNACFLLLHFDGIWSSCRIKEDKFYLDSSWRIN